MVKPIAILTDFGTKDPFVGIMKGVISRISPKSQIIDITHQIPAGDIKLAAFTLWQSMPYFPKETVFLAVVDPGVGSSRRPIFIESRDATFIGPDNGVFSYIIDDRMKGWEMTNTIYALPNPRKTFHGRDIFAPGAAHAAAGIPGSEFGDPCEDFELIPFPILESAAPGMISGEIIHVDRFGNALTSIGIFNPTIQGTHTLEPWVKSMGKMGESTEIQLNSGFIELTEGTQVNWAPTFSDIPGGRCAFLIGSSGLIEIAANRQSAVKLLNLKTGDRVTLIT